MRSSLLLMDTVSHAASSDRMPLAALLEAPTAGSSLHLQVHRIIHETGRFLDDVPVQYFQGVHRYLPIVSPRRFYRQMADPQVDPRADFAILLLSICLTTYRPAQHQPSSLVS